MTFLDTQSVQRYLVRPAVELFAPHAVGQGLRHHIPLEQPIAEIDLATPSRAKRPRRKILRGVDLAPAYGTTNQHGPKSSTTAA